MLACSVTLASGGSGGVFSPSLFIGATVGYTLGHMVHVLASPPVGRPEAYALVGMGALLSGATHAPVTSVLILFELTNSYGIILPLMLAITISSLTARILSPQSIYTRKLFRKGIKLFRPRDDLVMSTFRVRDVMRREIPTVQAGASFAAVLDRFLRAPIEELFVVDDRHNLCGKISLHDIKGVLGEEELHRIVTASDLMTEHPLTVQPADTLAECLQRLATTERDALPVVAEPGARQPIGLITRKDLLDLYDREILRREMIGTQVAADAARTSSLPAGHRVRTVPVPEAWTGRTLRDLDLRQRTGITVIGIQHRHQFGIADPAAPDVPLRAGDELVVLGTPQTVDALERFATARDASG
jgi:CIC family chloride channel protein